MIKSFSIKSKNSDEVNLSNENLLYRYYWICQACLSLPLFSIAFVHLFETFDRWNTQTIRKSFGNVLQQDPTVFYIAICIHLTLSFLLWLSLVRSVTRKPINSQHSKTFSTPALITIVLICFLPIIIFGQRSGFFWTLGLHFAIFHLMFYVRYKNILVYSIAMLLTCAIGSKQMAFFWLASIILSNQRINIKHLGIILLLGFFGLCLTLYIRNELLGVDIVFKIIMWREYSVEILGMAIFNYYYPIYHYEISTFLCELKAIIPSFIIGDKISVGNYFVGILMPEDRELFTDNGIERRVGFNRHFLFHFITDLGILGIPLGLIVFYNIFRWSFENIRVNGIYGLGNYIVYSSYFLFVGVLDFFIVFTIIPYIFIKGCQFIYEKSFIHR